MIVMIFSLFECVMKKLFLFFIIAFLIGCGSNPEKSVSESTRKYESVELKESLNSPVKVLSKSEKNLVQSELWLKHNLTKRDVVQTQSGLQYKKITETNGCQPNIDFPVTLHYDSRMIGQDNVFDSSYLRGAPGRFPIRKMIPAWVEGIPLMREGEKWELYVHPNLAYGEKGAGTVIPPNSLLIFTVEIINVEKCSG